MVSHRFIRHLNGPEFLLERDSDALNTFQSQANSAVVFNWGGSTFDIYLQVCSAQISIAKFSIYAEEKSSFEEKMAIIDSILKLCRGRNRVDMASMTIREWENYLRDTNEIESLSPAEMEKWHFNTTVFSDLIQLLITGISLGMKEQIGDAALPKRVSSSQSLVVNRLLWVKEYFENVISPIVAADGGAVEVLDWQNDKLLLSFTGACSACLAQEMGTLNFIRKSLSKDIPSSLLEGISEGLKVVAESTR